MNTTTDPAAKYTEETVIDVHYWTESLLSFRLTRPSAYRFMPGQYSRLGLPDERGQLVWRAFSVVSAPHEDWLEYYGVVVTGGEFTEHLRLLAPADRMSVDKHAFGFMTADRFTDGDTLWMLATGTGLGPYVSMLRDAAVWSRFKRLVLVHGARHVAELSYTTELRALEAASGGSLRLLQAVTRDPPASLPAGVLHGRITTLLQSGELEALAGASVGPDSARVMLCGNPAMIEETRALLHARGMRPVRRATSGHFITENYW
jgi:ferredoxin--NADP+ reductase